MGIRETGSLSVGNGWYLLGFVCGLFLFLGMNCRSNYLRMTLGTVVLISRYSEPKCHEEAIFRFRIELIHTKHPHCCLVDMSIAKTPAVISYLM